MKHNRRTYIINILFPCLIFSLITGLFTGGLIFLFKYVSSIIFNFSGGLFAYVRENPLWLPCLIVGAILLGLISAHILKHTRNCHGGGIPTSIGILRGLIELRWLRGIVYLFASSLVTFLGGVPLGNEGPSVQMGTAVGRGTVSIFAKKHKAWDRYIMTGGACGGFAVATGAPLTGMFFAFEEAHRRFSPMLFMTAAMTVVSATATMRLLCGFAGISPFMFDFSIDLILPLKYIWIAVVIGMLCGVIAILFTKLYTLIGDFLNKTLKKLPFALKIVSIFILVAISGFACEGLIGSGHDIIHDLINGHGIWYMIILYFCVRAIFLMLANNAGITGGIFIPTLTFGALIGALFSKIVIQIGILPQEYFAIPIIIGMASFLAASSRTPISAITFSIEALSGLTNILPIAIGVTLAFLVIETCGITSLNDMVMNRKIEKLNIKKQLVVVDSFVHVMEDSFAVGKEARDILWPPTCAVLSIKKSYNSHSSHETSVMGVGDLLHIHYQTYDQEKTIKELEAIVGKQIDIHINKAHNVNEKNHIVPET